MKNIKESFFEAKDNSPKDILELMDSMTSAYIKYGKGDEFVVDQSVYNLLCIKLKRKVKTHLGINVMVDEKCPAGVVYLRKRSTTGKRFETSL